VRLGLGVGERVLRARRGLPGFLADLAARASSRRSWRISGGQDEAGLKRRLGQMLSSRINMASG